LSKDESGPVSTSAVIAPCNRKAPVIPSFPCILVSMTLGSANASSAGLPDKEAVRSVSVRS
jgi:hypothetical protein